MKLAKYLSAFSWSSTTKYKFIFELFLRSLDGQEPVILE